MYTYMYIYIYICICKFVFLTGTDLNANFQLIRKKKTSVQKRATFDGKQRFEGAMLEVSMNRCMYYSDIDFPNCGECRSMYVCICVFYCSSFDGKQRFEGAMLEARTCVYIYVYINMY
jgi:hypothetical protein